jgi:DNA replication and repair protein RecF
MRLRHLSIANFRNLSAVEITPAPGLNIVYGSNGAGKTSLLEAIHFLARVRSFRSTRPQQLISRGADALIVRGVLGSEADRGENRLTVRRDAEKTLVRIDGKDVRSLSVLARHLPVQVVNSESQRLLLDGPPVRRSFLDWGVFHVEHGYYDHWRRYDRALRQRNRALRDGDERLARSWEPELVAQGEAVDRHREAYIERLAELAGPLLEKWLDGEQIAFMYRHGWAADKTLAQAFEEGRTREREVGYSLYGPHRADLVVRAGGTEAQHRLSRGQQKLLVMALLLASSRAMHARGEAVLLIDDLPAELDVARRQDVLKVLVEVGAQAFITTNERSAIPVADAAAKWFHVEHGRYHEVV